MIDQIPTMAEQLRRRFGPLDPPTVKPFSLTFRTIDQSTLIKAYREIAPDARQQRECDALRIAPTLGLMVPQLLDTGCIDGEPWAALELVPGKPADAATFLSQAGPVMSSLHRHVAPAGAGEGWVGVANTAVSNSVHLVGQLSPRVQSMPWWPILAKGLGQLDNAPAVYLHGDLKPEHILTSPAGTYVVDWEACARGPAVCDYADAYFHLARDLIYAGDAAPGLPVPAALPSGLPAALAWRLVLWVDRRRDQDLALMPAQALGDLAAAPDSPTARRAAVAIIDHMRRLGTPR